jgi:hypothetical protein
MRTAQYIGHGFYIWSENGRYRVERDTQTYGVFLTNAAALLFIEGQISGNPQPIRNWR